MGEPVTDSSVRAPAPALRPFLAGYAGFFAAGFPATIHHPLPSSCVHLLISLGRPIELVEMPNPRQRPGSFTSLVSGMQAGPAAVRVDGDAFGMHVYIKPLGARAILGTASAELASQIVSFSDIWGGRAGEIEDALRSAPNWDARFDVLDSAFLKTLRQFVAPSEIAWAWRRLQGSGGALAVRDLASETGFSARHFRERFRDYAGVAPKAAARTFRLERACRMIRDHRPGLAQVAAACGYFDQAHMTREWNALAGCSPAVWIARELPFLQDYEIGGGDPKYDDSQSVHRTYV